MADQYVSEDEVYSAMEAPVVRAILARAGTSLPMVIERATSIVKGYIRNSGYVLPAHTPPTDPVVGTDVTEGTVKSAVLSLVRRELSGLPSSSLELPKDYGGHPETLALKGILNGDVILDLPRSNIAQAVGGIKFTSTTGVNAGRAPRTSACQIKEY